MTVKQLSETFNVSAETIRRAIKELYPTKIIHGKPTRLDKEESIKIGEIIRKKGYMQPKIEESQNVTQESQNETLELKSMFMEFMRQQSEINKILISVISNNQNKQIDYKQDYYSIVAYSKLKNIKLTFSDLQKMGKEASRISREMGIETRRIPDERWGLIGSYNIKVLEQLFKIY